MNPSASSPCQYKIDELRALVEDRKGSGTIVSFLAITESWLEPYMTDAQIQIPGYIVSRCDRKGRGGGVCLYTQENFTISDEWKYDDGICQCLITVMPMNNLCNIVVYRPPDADEISFRNTLRFIREILEQKTDHSYQICISGDFNLPCIRWLLNDIQNGYPTNMASSAEDFLRLLSEKMMNQYIVKPTRGSNILDIFCTNDPFLVDNVDVDYTTLSDHKLVSLTLTISGAGYKNDYANDKQYSSGFSVLDFRRADYNQIAQKIKEVDWNQARQSCSFEEFPSIFTEILLDICQSCLPRKKPRTGRPKKWNALRRKKKRIERKLANCTKQGEKIKLDRELAMIHYRIKESYINNKKMEEATAINRMKTNPKSFFSYAKSHSKMRQDIVMMKDREGQVTRDPVKMSNILQNQFSSVYSDPTSKHLKEPNFPLLLGDAMSSEVFKINKEDVIAAAKDLKANSAPGPDGVPAELLIQCREALAAPLTILWQESFTTKTVPQYYKKSYICPIHKKNDRSQASNYRPISLTSHVMKLAERIVRRTMTSYLELNKLISEKQHGFRAGRSTLTQLLSHFDDILSGMLQGDTTDAIFLDYSKAFDKVDHQLLIKKLIRYGFSQNLVDWISSFLSERNQIVVVKGAHSTETEVISGVPQGTVLGPILFIVFINDLENDVINSSVSFFADDTRISKQIATVDCKNKLQADIVNVLNWSRANNMELNEEKFELQSYSNKINSITHEFPFHPELFSYSVSDSVLLEPTLQVKDLGVMVTNDLTWSNHIATIVAKAKGVASWALSVFGTREKDLMITIYKTLVRGHLEYCCPLWHPSKISDIELLENLQREFTRKIAGLQSLSYWERLTSLGIFSLQRRRERYILICIWKILNEKMPNPGIRFRAQSRLGIQAVIPSLNVNQSGRTSCQTKFDASFMVVGPKLWNVLPSNLTTEIFDFKFKGQLTNLLYKLDDNPPVSGYTRAHDNSLPEAMRRAAARRSLM